MGDLTTSLFRYEALRDGLSIRLINLHPATDALSELRCGIVHIDLLDASRLHPPFAALSYAWGSADKPCTLLCGTNIIPITASLDAALRAVRKTSWNQEDVLERNFQVANMIHIYSRAASVLLWTGEDDVESSGAKCLEWLQFIARRPTFALQCEIRPPEMKLLEEFFSRDWFMRRWVIQEAAVAAHAFVICGSKRISWYDFIEAVAILRVRHDYTAISSYHETLDKLCMIEILNKRHRIAETKPTTLDGPGLLQIMYHFEGSLCHDARDRVFSLMRLATLDDKDIESLSPILDYSLTTEIVYTSLASVLLKSSDHYALLQFAAAFRTENTSQSTLPSWVPDWRLRPRFIPLLHPDFKCGLGRPGDVRFNTDGSLTIQGWIYDYVESHDQLPQGYDEDFIDVTEALGILSHRDAVEKVGFLRGNIHPAAVQHLSMSEALVDHLSSLRDSKLALEEAARETKSSSKEHALQAHASWQDKDTIDADTPANLLENLLQSKMMRGRKLFTTRKGGVGIGPYNSRQGDTVVILYGARTPFIFRKNAEDNGWRIIGDAYVSNITRTATKARRSVTKEFRIV
jgi:hypothetical protein